MKVHCYELIKQSPNIQIFPMTSSQGRTENSWGNRGSWGPCVLAHTHKSL
ncbi:unnamed protein product [Staurois parvus]|uniref:Uncharacterized protein n=1 Tax=Staurois parvus TaxID=386267 RepID=A0ABN9D080_9NEOB|nr:unnamed protein product [Staurois parvus]